MKLTVLSSSFWRATLLGIFPLLSAYGSDGPWNTLIPRTEWEFQLSSPQLQQGGHQFCGFVTHTSHRSWRWVEFTVTLDGHPFVIQLRDIPSEKGRTFCEKINVNGVNAATTLQRLLFDYRDGEWIWTEEELVKAIEETRIARMDTLEAYLRSLLKYLLVSQSSMPSGR